MTNQSFPSNFLWGTATASYQIEGAAHEDGRGESIWDRFSHTPGLVKNNDTGDVACDHYHLYKEDVQLMKQLGVKAYRFSVAWPRILPTGSGSVNQAGLDFYSRLVDELLKADIQPFATLYHWDLPVELEDRGGWTNRDIAGWFADYAAIVVRALGDRVHDWITLNEPWCTAFLGYSSGEHAPGIRNPRLAMQATHNTLLAHGLGMQAIRAAGDAATRAGITLNMGINLPATDSAADQAAAADAMDQNWELFTLPIFTGHYSNRMIEQAGNAAPHIQPGDMALICARNDFLGLNYYTPSRISATANHGTPGVVRNPAAEYTTMDWEVHPDGLYQLLLRLRDLTHSKTPIYITENGAAFKDVLTPDGHVHDERRVDFLRGHFDAARRAIAAGVDLRGYFVWSLMDNFEWAHGYTQFFGLVNVDYATQRRTIKDSGYYLRDVIAANAVI
jgi:beta-glucosidase